MTTRVFVYGTLKRGKENHDWLAGQHFEKQARTKPLYRMLDMGGYPALIRDEAGIAVEGEIWQVDEACLTRLDVLEDIDGGEYERAPIELEDERVEGYVYLWDVSGRRDVGTCW